jgi:nucleoside-diphosphate-sugar epimerase
MVGVDKIDEMRRAYFEQDRSIKQIVRDNRRAGQRAFTTGQAGTPNALGSAKRVDISAAMNNLGFRPSIGLEDGIRFYSDWLATRRPRDAASSSRQVGAA